MTTIEATSQRGISHAPRRTNGHADE